MALPGWLARFNRNVTNRVSGSFAGRVRGFGIVEHVGRRSGKRYRTPVNIFRSPDGFVIALTYGRDRDWVKNVMAAGGCRVETRGKTVHLVEPRIVTDERQTPVPRSIRQFLRAMGVDEFMELRTAPGTAPPG